MRRPVSRAGLLPFLVMALAPQGAVHAQTSPAVTSCAQWVEPLVARLRQADARLEAVDSGDRRQAELSRLLAQVMSGEDERKAFAAIVTCLTGARD